MKIPLIIKPGVRTKNGYIYSEDVLLKALDRKSKFPIYDHYLKKDEVDATEFVETLPIGCVTSMEKLPYGIQDQLIGECVFFGKNNDIPREIIESLGMRGDGQINDKNEVTELTIRYFKLNLRGEKE